MMRNNKFNGKVAIVTGSSRGIGKAIAKALAKQGAHIVLNGRDPGRLAAAETELLTIHERVMGVCCDVSTNEGGQTLVDETLSKFKKIDILICNAGISMRGNFVKLQPGVYQAMFISNVMSAVCPGIPALPHLRMTQGSLVFISSLAGIRGLPGTSAYCSSKMSLRAIAESIRIEEARHRIHVGLVYVGYTEIEDGKETLNADGSMVLLKTREGRGVQSVGSVADAVLKNLSKRKFITVLSPIGKVHSFMQRLAPWLVERMIINNLHKFEERSN
jgi:NAD(P)-dependent dehydrogenase (short-subunit alcohol dehydrogenase family)